jgi:hypothetical protein
MKLTELIKELHDKKTGVFINGMGLGKITEIESDFISFEVVRKEENKKGTTLKKELTHIPIDKIETISEGEKELPKSNEDAKIEDALGGI